MARFLVLTQNQWRNFDCTRRLGCGRVAFRDTPVEGDFPAFARKKDAMDYMRRTLGVRVLLHEAQYPPQWHYQMLFKGKAA